MSIYTFQTDEKFYLGESMVDVIPEDVIVMFLEYLTPQEQALASATHTLFHQCILEVCQESFFQIFGKIPNNLSHKQVMGVLQNTLKAQTKIDKARKILCWAASKNYIKLIHLAQQKIQLQCLDGQLNMKPSKCRQGMTPLYLACREGNKQIVKFMSKLSDFSINEICGPNEQTITHEVCRRGFVEILDMLSKMPKWEIDKRDVSEVK